MPTWTPKPPGTLNWVERGGTDAAASTATNAKGAWTQSIAETAAETDLITLGGRFQNPEASFLIDIGIGGAGSEEVIIENWPLGQNNDFDMITKAMLPIRIQKGERLSVRHQSDVISANLGFGIGLHQGSPWPAGQYAVMEGADLSTSTLQRVDAGSSYVELSSGLIYNYKYICPYYTGRGANFSVADHSSFLWAVGSEGDERDFYIIRSKIENLQDRISGHQGLLMNTFPSGTRITGVFSDGTFNVGMGMWGII